jgi:hypothetical protein
MSASWAPQRNARHVRKLGTPSTSTTQTQLTSVTLGTSVTSASQRNTRHVRKLGSQMQCKASSQDGRPNEKCIRNEKVHTREHYVKRRAGGWIRTNFVLEVDFLIRPHQGWPPQRNERCIRMMGAQTQRKEHPQDGRPNEKPIHNKNVHTREHQAKRRAGGWIRTNFYLEVYFLIRPHQGWAPKCNARCVRNMGAKMQHKAHPQVGRPNGTQGTSASWAPQRNARHVCNLGDAAHIRNANARHVHTSPSCALQHNARHVCKMVAQTQNSSATKTSTQGSTRLKDQLEDG